MTNFPLSSLCSAGSQTKIDKAARLSRDSAETEERPAMIFPNTNPEYGRVVFGSARLELWLRLAGCEELVLSWDQGNCGLVISVPHAGRLGEDK